MLEAVEITDMLAGRFFGRKLPFWPRMMQKFVVLAIRETQERLNSSERREDMWRVHARKVKAKRDGDYTRSAQAAVAEAKDLVFTYITAGKPNWKEACREMEIHERTAQNLLALLALHEQYPAAFKLFAKMGRSKLYMLARLPKEVLERLTLEKDVTIGNRRVTLADLSARELKWYLKQVCPKGDGKRIPALKQAIDKCAEIADRPVGKLGMERGELKEAADKLEIVLEKVRIKLREAS
jgi:hypothetical protein